MEFKSYPAASLAVVHTAIALRIDKESAAERGRSERAEQCNRLAPAQQAVSLHARGRLATELRVCSCD